MFVDAVVAVLASAEILKTCGAVLGTLFAPAAL
jgi:hypothetical protein